MTDLTRILLTEAEITAASGGYDQPKKQLDALHRAGFWRARFGKDGRIIVERAHYEAVCAGAVPSEAQSETLNKPKLRLNA